jgi:hypothetical protein
MYAPNTKKYFQQKIFFDNKYFTPKQTEPKYYKISLVAAFLL